jgi:hypothetical protein
VLVVGFVLWLLATADREPTHAGRPLSAWVEELEGEAEPDVVEALTTIGTNAIPHLLQMTTMRVVPTWKHFLARTFGASDIFGFRLHANRMRSFYAAYAFAYLGPGAETAVPALTNLLQKGENPITAAIALARLGGAGTDYLLQHISSSDVQLRQVILRGLGHARREPEKAVPALLASLKDSDPTMRSISAISLGTLRSEPGAVVPALVEALGDPATGVTHSAAMALGQLGPLALAALDPLSKATNSPDPFLSKVAAHAIRIIRYPDP